MLSENIHNVVELLQTVILVYLVYAINTKKVKQ